MTLTSDMVSHEILQNGDIVFKRYLTAIHALRRACSHQYELMVESENEPEKVVDNLASSFGSRWGHLKEINRITWWMNRLPDTGMSLQPVAASQDLNGVWQVLLIESEARTQSENNGSD